jgi:hypothetical protein
MKVFDFVNAITYNKQDLMRNCENPSMAEKIYVPYIVNRSLSYHMDTVLYANEMNISTHLDSILQFDYLINSIRKQKRYAKWHKNNNNDLLATITTYFGCGYDEAHQISRLLTDEQIKQIEGELEKGGKQN